MINQTPKIELFIKIKAITGEIYTVRKYILDNEGKQNIWCNDWYGHHVIGQDCEWVIEQSDKK